MKFDFVIHAEVYGPEGVKIDHVGLTVGVEAPSKISAQLSLEKVLSDLVNPTPRKAKKRGR